jgi:hypothetical protein
MNQPEQLKMFYGGVFTLKVRDGNAGTPALYKIEERPQHLLVGPEALELLKHLAADPGDLWRRLVTPDETFRARCERALAAYQRLIQ